MDDLISKADVCEILADIYPTDGEAVISYKEIDRAYTKVQDLPSVPAVPLDKLCEWLALRFGYPCQTIDDCNGWYVSDCVSHDGNKVACWEQVLTKWMEGLDDK